MAIDALGVTTAAATQATNKSSAALADTFDTFLKLLTAQLQNQDPLSPMDSAKFTEQLVQYSQVEQQISTNSKLDSLAKQISANGSGSALSYLGRTALFDSNATALVDGKAKWQYAIDTGAAAATLTVKDSKGAVVYTASGNPAAGPHTFEWDGSLTGLDTKAPAGTYYLTATAQNGAGQTIETAVAVEERISGVDFSGTSPNVTTASGARALDKILRIAETLS